MTTRHPTAAQPPAAPQLDPAVLRLIDVLARADAEHDHEAEKRKKREEAHAKHPRHRKPQR